MVGVLAENKAWRAIRIGEKIYHAKNKLTKELKAKLPILEIVPLYCVQFQLSTT